MFWFKFLADVKLQNPEVAENWFVSKFCMKLVFKCSSIKYNLDDIIELAIEVLYFWKYNEMETTQATYLEFHRCFSAWLSYVIKMRNALQYNIFPKIYQNDSSTILDLLDLDAQDSSSPRSLQTADCTPITTVRWSALCGSNREPCVFSHLSDPFLGWPVSRSWIWEIFSVGFGDTAFRGGVLWCGQTISAVFADVLVSQPFSARHR